ncbi:Gp11 [Pseudocitrobacter vendiensis]|nr:Gp11 [Pseudocitrobacter vendiensis]
MPSSEGLSEARMITTEQAKEYLESVGITLPDFILQALLEQAGSIQECLDAHYPPATALLIQSYLLGLMALGQGDKYISSQTGPNGASRSFRYLSFADRWKASLGLLRGLDKYGCATSLIPPDPTNTAFAGIWIARGGCMCNGSR